MIKHKQTKPKNDIYNIPILGFVFKNQKFIKMMQITTLFLFSYGIVMGFKEPSGENIFTIKLFWGLFWTLFIVVSLTSFGRIFCGICPHGFLGKYITKFGLKKEMPKLLQNRFIGMFILLFGWWGILYLNPGFWTIPLVTAWLFTSVTAIAFVMYYLYKDMSYCKYICPIGTLLKSYSKIAPTFLHTYKEDCNSCRTFECASACSYNLKPFTFNKKNTMEDCTLCMDCSSACDAVAFSIVKPSKTLLEKFKYNKAEVWAFILFTAAISITMGFRHGLGRTAIADNLIWTKTAIWIEQYIDFGTFSALGISTFFYALLLSITVVYFGMFVASRFLNASFEKTFYTFGYAFAPLFIIGGLAHLISSFSTHNFAAIINSFIYGFGLDFQNLENLANRGDSWLMYLKVIPYFASAWGFFIIFKRLKQFEASKLKKIFAFIFASSLVTFYLSLQIYSAYVFKTYGVKKGGHSHHKSSTEIKQNTQQKYTQTKTEN